MDELVHLCCPACLRTNRMPRARLGEKPNCGACHAPLFTGAPIELRPAAFHAFLDHTELPVVVDFWAGWCGPCKTMAPHFAQAAAELEPRVRCAKLDTDAAPAIAGEYGIRSIPTLIVFRRGRELARQSGALDRGQILRFVDSAISGHSA